jgi:hypothetical protein
MNASSYAYAVCGTQQVGAYKTDFKHACLWAGSAFSYVDLSPNGYWDSEALATTGKQQAGHYYNPFQQHCAGFWSGSSDSYVSLSAPNASPPGVQDGVVYAISGAHQVGVATMLDVNPTAHAALWSGSISSFVDLNPDASVARKSYAYACTDSKQGGEIILPSDAWGSSPHAALWSGTAASCVDLHPVGAASSVVFGMSDSFQAGKAVFYIYSQPHPHAALWSGTAASFVDLNPADPDVTSTAYAACGPLQAGECRRTGSLHAVIWSGTAASMVDLHSVLGTNYSESSARGIWTDGTTIRVVGGATYFNGMNHAMLWTVQGLQPPAPPPQFHVASAQNLGGTNVLTLTWTNDTSWSAVEAGSSITGGWDTVNTPWMTNGSWVSTTISNTAPSQFFRLRR